MRLWRRVGGLTLLPLFAFIIGCGEGSQTIAKTGNANAGYAAPGTFGVVAISPAPGATNVTSTTIQITFSSTLDLATVNPTNIQVTGPGSSAVTGTSPTVRLPTS